MSNRLDDIHAAIAAQALPPVNDWHPARSGTIDIVIQSNGDWLYRGSRIQRERMVRLFASVLRTDEAGQTWLVTPVEKLAITVDDAPFTAVLLERHWAPEAQTLVFTTNLGEQVIADAEHPVRVEYPNEGDEPRPYVRVRDRLDALISRSVFLQLAGYLEQQGGFWGVVSRGCFMPVGRADE